jgi:hypothetical protein
MRIPTVIAILGAAVCGWALVYAAVQWWRWQDKRSANMSLAAVPRSHAREARPEPSVAPTELAIGDPAAAQVDFSRPNPKILGKLRSGREGDRPSEDDLAQQHIGWRGLPGEPAPPNPLPEKITQIPKPLDPGHTA